LLQNAERLIFPPRALPAVIAAGLRRSSLRLDPYGETPHLLTHGKRARKLALGVRTERRQ
jgi:hypothetical protein